MYWKFTQFVNYCHTALFFQHLTSDLNSFHSVQYSWNLRFQIKIFGFWSKVLSFGPKSWFSLKIKVFFWRQNCAPLEIISFASTTTHDTPCAVVHAHYSAAVVCEPDAQGRRCRGIGFHWFSSSLVFQWFSLVLYWFSLVFIDFHWFGLEFIDFHWFSFFFSFHLFFNGFH